MNGGPSVIRRPTIEKSNVELINSFRANFLASQITDSSLSSRSTLSKPSLTYSSWTTRDGDILYVPSHAPTPLAEPRESYDITVKLFYLPHVPPSRRCQHTKEAMSLVLKELGVSSIDLLIVSFPGVSFDVDDDGEREADCSDSESGSDGQADGMDTMTTTWRTLETFHENGTISQLGLAEFGSDRLAKFLPNVTIKPSVDQINVKDCCVVPKSIVHLAKQENIELLTHNDCTDILSRGTIRDLLGPRPNGAGVLAAAGAADDEGLKGDIEPQWVVKYTAVVKDRGVIENKGYFAVAQVGDCIERCMEDPSC